MYYSTQCDEIVHSPEQNQTKDSIEKSPELAKEALNESSRSDSIRTEAWYAFYSNVSHNLRLFLH